jgi:hypothetical protein
MTSLVLGTIALVLAFLPVLGIPISALALFFGLGGLGVAFFAGGASMRWSLAGLLVSSLALSVNLALARAPAGYLPAPGAPRPRQPIPDRPYVPPPSRSL